MRQFRWNSLWHQILCRIFSNAKNVIKNNIHKSQKEKVKEELIVSENRRKQLQQKKMKKWKRQTKNDKEELNHVEGVGKVKVDKKKQERKRKRKGAGEKKERKSEWRIKEMLKIRIKTKIVLRKAQRQKERSAWRKERVKNV